MGSEHRKQGSFVPSPSPHTLIRAPPDKRYETYCPDDPWRWDWDTSDSQLTGPGYSEEAAIGLVTRADYGHLIGVYNGSRHTVRATASDRVLQSAEVAMSTLFPPGMGPRGGLPTRPTFVPIHTLPESEDDLLVGGARKHSLTMIDEHLSGYGELH